MSRQYIISNDLDELEQAQQELIDSGVEATQIEVLSEDDAGVEKHHLHGMPSLAKTDLVWSTIRGSLLGFTGMAIVLIVAGSFELTSVTGWAPFVLLAIVVLGICSWEGGLWGIHRFNSRYRKFEERIKNGEHVMIVDFAPILANDVQKVVQVHPKLSSASF
ncbi:Uncharacterised protein [BD1-7 clade bacterium]|uniref:NAD/FAD-utilizing enzyme apparently involved in cell division n=1 Tax=BD1-7 clade bacterium TaxID=2029982 RepID=A0A5S9PSJ6_9GAMM|nr:Uncharacterised protein [BD1-7 clade bacterium]